MNTALNPPPIPTPALGHNLDTHYGWFRAFQGIWMLTWKANLTWRRIPIHLASVLILPLLAYFTVDDGEATTYLHWTIDFYLLLLLPLYCLFTCGAMIRDELQGDTLGFLVTRPLTRAQLLVIKFLCHVTWLQAIALLNGLLLFIAGLLRHIPGVGSLMFILLAAQILAVFAYGALSTLFGLVHQRYMVLGIIYGAVVEMGIGKIPTNINTLSLSHHIQTLLGNCDTIKTIHDWSPTGTFFSLMVMALAIPLFLGLASVLFTFREYHHSDEMQK